MAIEGPGALSGAAGAGKSNPPATFDAWLAGINVGQISQSQGEKGLTKLQNQLANFSAKFRLNPDQRATRDSILSQIRNLNEQHSGLAGSKIANKIADLDAVPNLVTGGSSHVSLGPVELNANAAMVSAAAALVAGGVVAAPYVGQALASTASGISGAGYSLYNSGGKMVQGGKDLALGLLNIGGQLGQGVLSLGQTAISKGLSVLPAASNVVYETTGQDIPYAVKNFSGGTWGLIGVGIPAIVIGVIDNMESSNQAVVH